MDEARKTFDLNVFALLAVTQEFVPLLLKCPRKHSLLCYQHSPSHPFTPTTGLQFITTVSGKLTIPTDGGVIVNNTSVASLISIPHSGIYNASKAAAAMLTNNMRIELAPFGIQAVELKTGGVSTNFSINTNTQGVASLPESSIYQPAKKEVEKIMGEVIANDMTAKQWAEKVVRDLDSKSPSARIWRGAGASIVWFVETFWPHTSMDGLYARMGGLDVLGERLGRGRGRSWFWGIVATVMGT